MNKRTPFIGIVGAMVLLAGCSADPPAGPRRVEITPPAADLTFDEAFVKDRDIHLTMPEDVVLGGIGYTLVDAKGHLIVADHIQNTVFQTDAEGRYLRQIGARGGAEGEYFYIGRPRLAPNGDLYFHSFGASNKCLFFEGDSYKFKREVPNPNPQLIDHFGSDLLVLSQYRRVVRGKPEYYLNLFYKDGHSVTDGIRLPADHRLLTIDGSELYFAVEGAFDEATGEAGDPYVAVYRLNDRTRAGKTAFNRS